MILVTGATGLIGLRVVNLLAKKYDPAEILCLVWEIRNAKELAARKNLKRLGVKMREIDLLDTESLVGLPSDPKLVFHLAATTDTALPDHRCNDIGTRNLVEALNMGNKTHFVYTGTCAMYCGRKDCRKPITERTRPVPTNRYSLSKLRAEQFLKRQAKQKGFGLTILRPPTVYGANPRVNSLFDFLKKLIIKKSPLARLNWPGLTSLVWVDDMARTIIWSAKFPLKPGRIKIFTISVEALTLAEISRLMHVRMRLPYKRIDLPSWFWKIAASCRKLIYLLERLLPSSFYNLLWRASLVTDDVLVCDVKKINRYYLAWKPALFKDKVDEVL